MCETGCCLAGLTLGESEVAGNRGRERFGAGMVRERNESGWGRKGAVKVRGRVDERVMTDRLGCDVRHGVMIRRCGC